MALTDIKRPVGTVEELQKDNIDIAVVPTCARPMEGVVGCQYWTKCNLSIKGKSGPRNYAVTEFKGEDMGGATLTNERDCQWIAQHREAVEDNGGVIKIVAAEGQEYTTFTMAREDEKLPLSPRVYKEIKKPVAPYHRLDMNHDYKEYLQRNVARAAWRNQKEAEREERIIGGHNEPSEPLDAGVIGGVKGSGSKK